jgi:DNA-directed RNA polymerase subunit F
MMRDMPRKTLDQKDITIAEAKRILEGVKQEELGEFQRRTLDFATKFSKTTPAKAERLMKDLTEKAKLSRAEAIQVVNCMPETIEELRTILTTKGKVIATDQLEEILKLVSRATREG